MNELVFGQINIKSAINYQTSAGRKENAATEVFMKKIVHQTLQLHQADLS